MDNRSQVYDNQRWKKTNTERKKTRMNFVVVD